ncbi:MAG: LysE family transporter [Saprospiraceae bacterium]
MLALVAGFGLSLVGSLPPGLMNLTVARTAMQRGLWAAGSVAAGAAAAEFFQAAAAVVFSDWFVAHPASEQVFRWLAAPVFLALGAYFLFWAKPPRHSPETDVRAGRAFVKGLIISVFNLLAVPYWIFYCGWLRLEGWLSDGFSDMILLAVGVTLGTFAALMLYAWAARKMAEGSVSVGRWANRLTGAVLLFLGLRLTALLLL